MRAVNKTPQGPEQSELGLEATSSLTGRLRRFSDYSERIAGSIFLMPAILLVLFLAIFPLIVSAYMSVSRLKFVKGGFEINFVGMANYKKLFLGSEQSHFLGSLGDRESHDTVDSDCGERQSDRREKSQEKHAEAAFGQRLVDMLNECPHTEQGQIGVHGPHLVANSGKDLERRHGCT